LDSSIGLIAVVVFFTVIIVIIIIIVIVVLIVVSDITISSVITIATFITCRIIHVTTTFFKFLLIVTLITAHLNNRSSAQRIREPAAIK